MQPMNGGGLPPVPDFRAMPAPRKLMLAGLALCFVSLFFSYDTGASYPLTIPGVYVDITTPIAITDSGFHIKPLGGFVVAGLFWVFYSALHQNPFWQRYGYWTAFALVALLATPSGFLPWVAAAMVGAAALLHGKSAKTPPAR